MQTLCNASWGFLLLHTGKVRVIRMDEDDLWQV